MVYLRDHLVWLNYRMFKENSEEWTGIVGQLPSLLLIIHVHLIL